MNSEGSAAFETESTVDVLADHAGPEFWAALVEAQKAASTVGKDSKNAHYGYSYASAEALLTEGREALGKAGMGLMSTWWNFFEHAEPRVQEANQYGKGAYVVIGRMVVRYRLFHSSGQYLVLESSTPVIPESGRPDDKAESTALTYNFGYITRGILMLPRVEKGTDVDQRNDDGEEKGRRVTTRRRDSKPQPTPAPEPIKQATAKAIGSWGKRYKKVAKTIGVEDLSFSESVKAALEDAELPVREVERLKDLTEEEGKVVREWLTNASKELEKKEKEALNQDPENPPPPSEDDEPESDDNEGCSDEPEDDESLEIDYDILVKELTELDAGALEGVLTGAKNKEGAVDAMILLKKQLLARKGRK